MATLTPQGDKLRALRLDRGWTQLELAIAAGVSDRTVRKAERSQPLRRQFLEYLAGALQVPLTEVAQSSRELVEHLNWQQNCARFVVGMHKALVERDPSHLVEIAHRELEFHVHSLLPNVDSLSTFLGDYHTSDELPRLVDNINSFWELDPGGTLVLDEPIGSGNTIVIRGHHELWQRDGGVTWGRFNYITEFEGGRIRSVEGLMRPGSPPPGVTGILIPQNSQP